MRSLYEVAAAKSLVDEMTKHKIQLLALQEIRWKDSNTTRIGNYNFYHSDGQKHMLGVGFAIHKDLCDKVMDFRSVSDRICAIRIKTKFFNLDLINAHAETEEKDNFTKDAFYNTLKRTYDSLPSNDIKMILGDLNAKIGREDISTDHKQGKPTLTLK